MKLSIEVYDSNAEKKDITLDRKYFDNENKLTLAGKKVLREQGFLLLPNFKI